jgi:hypothetical protein
MGKDYTENTWKRKGAHSIQGRWAALIGKSYL